MNQSIKNQFTLNPVRLTHLLTFSFCYLVLVIGCSLSGLFVYNHVVGTVSYSELIAESIFGGLTGGLIASYIPLVFLAVAPSVILESIVENPQLKNGLMISPHSWQNKFLFPGDGGKNLCNHCWAVPFRMFVTWIAGGLFLIVIIPIAMLIRAILLAGVMALSYSWNLKLENWNHIYKVWMDWEANPKRILSHELRKERPAPVPTRKVTLVSPDAPMAKILSGLDKFANLFGNFVIKLFDVIVNLKRSACPTVQWTTTEAIAERNKLRSNWE